MTDKEKLVELLEERRMQASEVLGSMNKGFGAWYADHLIANGVTVLPESGIGDMSDGYHTFNELYHHRAVLFSVICNLNPFCSWKAKKHHDGTMYDGMFIVGINTPEGQATYHYDIDPYWDIFKVPEAEFAPEWDGHTADEAIRRIALLGRDGEDNDVPTKWISVNDRLPEEHDSIWAKLYVTKSWQPGLFRKCSYDVIACVEKKDGRRRVISIRTYDGKWDHNKLNEEAVICWQPMPKPPKGD